MLLAIPYHSGSPVNYANVGKVLRKTSGNARHTLLVIARPCDEDEAFKFANSCHLFGDIQFVLTLKDGENPTEGANLMLQTALRFHREYVVQPTLPGEVPNPPMAYLDPKWTPKADRWLDQIQAEFFQNGAPDIMGDHLGSGAISWADKPDFNALVVFGPDYFAKSALVPFLDTSTHWRRFLAWEMVRNSVVIDLSRYLTDKPPTK